MASAVPTQTSAKPTLSGLVSFDKRASVRNTGEARGGWSDGSSVSEFVSEKKWWSKLDANRLMLKSPTNSHTKEAAVFVEKCKYLKQSKCVGICVNTCKLHTQAFMKDYMGVPLVMVPNFSDYSCQFKFGILPPLPEDDTTLKEPCLDICPNATRRREFTGNINVQQCPKA